MKRSVKEQLPRVKIRRKCIMLLGLGLRMFAIKPCRLLPSTRTELETWLKETNHKMRIAFLGKGGSGKTTAAAGFVRYAAKKHPFVLAIDADVNVHMTQALNLNFKGEVKELGNAYDEVINFLKGQRDDLGDRPMVASAPPTYKSNFVMVSPNDQFLRKYAVTDGPIALLTVGSYDESDVGSSCYHGKLYSLAAMLHHTLDTENDIVIADTTAGTDNVATSLHLAYDLNVFIVEPTEKSVKVFHDFVGLAPHLAERTFVVANKVDGQKDEEFLKRNIPADKLLATIPLSKNLKRFEQGRKEALDEFQAEQAPAFDAIYKKLKERRRDWAAYLKHLKESHQKVSRKWLNPFYGMELDVNLNSDFDYERAISKEGEARTPAEAPKKQRKLELAFNG